MFYITSLASEEVIKRTIKEVGDVCIGRECSDDVYLLKYVHQNRDKLKKLEKLLIDINALQDADDEIIQALEILKIENYQTRIIILASGRKAGDEIIRKCVDMAIYDVIISDSYKDISDELKICLTRGKQYKDAVVLKQDMGPEIEKDIIELVKDCTDAAITEVIMSDVFGEICTDLKYCLMVGKQYNEVAQIKDSESFRQEIVTAKKVLKRTANKILVGVAGAQARIGCSHLCILTASHLSKKGYTVALLEYGNRGVWNAVMESNEKELDEEKCFSINGIDYYPNICEQDINTLVSNKSYNFLIVDFGVYKICDKLMYNKCDTRMLVTGAKPWETEYIGEVFQNTDKKTLEQINYVFNFVSRASQTEVRREMKGLNHIYFMPLSEDPFSSTYIGDIEEIFNTYELQEEPRRKKGLSLNRLLNGSGRKR